MDVQDILQKHGIRPTEARVAVLKKFLKASLPLDVSDLTTGALMDPVTIYRILDLYVEKGILLKLELGEGKFRYELAGHEHHHHAVCTNCGRIVDVEDCIGDKITKNVAKETGYVILSHRLEFFGLCPNCR